MFQYIGRSGIRTHVHVLTVHMLQLLSYLLSSQTMRRLNALQDQVTTKLKPPL